MRLPQRNLKSVSTLVLFGFLLSCRNPRQEYIRGILSDVCFWDVLEKDFSLKNVRYSYRLLPDGRCYKYCYNYRNEEKQNSVSHMDKEKGEVDIKWHLKSDSVLTIGKEDYKVQKVDKNAVWLETSSSDGILLQKSCSTYIID